MKQYTGNINKRVTKTSKVKRNGKSKVPKPFKSGNLVNTIKSVIEHPILKIPAYTFYEDDSYVECRRCILLN